jgi:RNA polymerase sigma-70 factor (ECF subfamily)
MTIPQQRIGAGQPAWRRRGVGFMMTAAQDRGVTYDEFFKTEYPRLVPMLRALTADRQRAEDIAQEALWRAQRHWDRISTYDRPGAWVRRVALNASANVRRSRQREERALTRIAGAAARSGDRALEDARDGDDELWRLVRELPEQQRFAIVLHYVEDRSVADIAEVLQCSEGTVKTHLSRGRAALARGLTSAGTEVGHD